MSEIITVGPDLEKNVFQLHGANDAGGGAVLCQKLRRAQVLEFFSQLPSCVVAIGSPQPCPGRCAVLRFWGRKFGKVGHDVALIPTAYLKSF